MVEVARRGSSIGRAILAAVGIACASVSYRLREARKYPAAVEDAMRRALMRPRQELGVDQSGRLRRARRAGIRCDARDDRRNPRFEGE